MAFGLGIFGRFARCAAIIGVLGVGSAAAPPALAKAKKAIFTIPLSSTFIYGQANYEAGGALLDDAGIGYVEFDFMLPPDYKPNSKAKISFFFWTAPAACAAVFRASHIGRSRVGEAGGFESDPGQVRPKGGPVVNLPLPNVAVRKKFTLKLDSLLKGQKAGDMIWLAMVRTPDEAADTCGNILLSGIEVEYKTTEK